MIHIQRNITMNKIIFNERSLNKLIGCITGEILLAYEGQELPVLIGIKTRGANLATKINIEIEKYTGRALNVGYLDISFYRDDLSKLAEQPLIKQPQIHFDINNRKVLLIDDVLYTGRTTKAALDALVAIGRPKEVKLAVLIDRGHREFPIEANFVGKKLETTDNEVVHVHFKETDGIDNVEICNKKFDKS